MSTPAIDLNNSMPTWFTEPLPADPYDRLPGLALASASISGNDFADTLLFKIRMNGDVPIRPTGAKSPIGSKLRLLFSEGIMAVAVLPTYSV